MKSTVAGSTHPRNDISSRLNLAELSSSMGAGVLGAGLGVVVADQLGGFGWPIVVAGLVMHAWGMTDKHQLEASRGESRPAWSTVLYWVCWLALLALLVLIVWRAVG
jgi:hypothetical protein